VAATAVWPFTSIVAVTTWSAVRNKDTRIESELSISIVFGHSASMNTRDSGVGVKNGIEVGVEVTIGEEGVSVAGLGVSDRRSSGVLDEVTVGRPAGEVGVKASGTGVAVGTRVGTCVHGSSVGGGTGA